MNEAMDDLADVVEECRVRLFQAHERSDGLLEDDERHRLRRIAEGVAIFAEETGLIRFKIGRGN